MKRLKIFNDTNVGLWSLPCSSLQDVIELVRNTTGVNDTNVNTIWSVYDTLFCEVRIHTNTHRTTEFRPEVKVWLCCTKAKTQKVSLSEEARNVQISSKIPDSSSSRYDEKCSLEPENVAFNDHILMRICHFKNLFKFYTIFRLFILW